MNQFKFILCCCCLTLFCNAQSDQKPELISPKENSPRFPGCEKLRGTDIEKDACAQKKFLEYFYNGLTNIEKPKDVSKRIVIQFVVTKKGKRVDVKLVYGEQSVFTDAAIVRLEEMNKLPEQWTPGIQGGNFVNVKYTLPVKVNWED